MYYFPEYLGVAEYVFFSLVVLPILPVPFPLTSIVAPSMILLKNLLNLHRNLAFTLCITFLLYSELSDAAIIKDEVLKTREKYDNLVAKLEERGSGLESIRIQVDLFNKSYAEVSEWLERAEKFQLEQKNIEMDLQSIRVLTKEQKVSFLAAAIFKVISIPISSKAAFLDICVGAY